jgi:hypothetical protein
MTVYISQRIPTFEKKKKKKKRLQNFRLHGFTYLSKFTQNYILFSVNDGLFNIAGTWSTSFYLLTNGLPDSFFHLFARIFLASTCRCATYSVFKIFTWVESSKKEIDVDSMVSWIFHYKVKYNLQFRKFIIVKNKKWR